MCGTNWPADFNGDRDVRHERFPHRWADNYFADDKTGMPQRRYILYRYYLLCGDEGKEMGVGHILSKREKLPCRRRYLGSPCDLLLMRGLCQPQAACP